MKSYCDIATSNPLYFNPRQKLLDRNWFALWTNARTEKKLSGRLESAGITTFLPLQKTIRHWKDRRKIIELPLFPSYLFVFINHQEYYQVLNVPGSVRFICFEGKPVVIPEKQIEAIRLLLMQDIKLNITPENLPKGSKVKIIAGPMIGMEAELTNYLNGKVVILRIEGINRSMIIHIPASLLEIVN